MTTIVSSTGNGSWVATSPARSSHASGPRRRAASNSQDTFWLLDDLTRTGCPAPPGGYGMFQVGFLTALQPLRLPALSRLSDIDAQPCQPHPGAPQ